MNAQSVDHTAALSLPAASDRRTGTSLDKAESTTSTTIRPGQVGRDTEGKRIQAHGGSIITGAGGLFYWYGENKEKTTPGSGNWHWGVRAYSSSDLVNWDDRGLIIPPVTSDPASPLHPAQKMDRPHILLNETTGKYVCWLKIMGEDDGHTQASTVLVADDLLGPYEIVRTGLRPHHMDAGDFDLTVDPETGKAYYYFEKVHTELICAELTDDYTDVAGKYSSHFPHPAPLHARGTRTLRTERIPLPHHLGDDRIFPQLLGGRSRLRPPRPLRRPRQRAPRRRLTHLVPLADQLCFQASAQEGPLRRPRRPVASQLPEDIPNVYDVVAAMTRGEAPPPSAGSDQAARAATFTENTAIADYVWLPLRFDGDRPYIEWLDEWSPDDFD